MRKRYFIQFRLFPILFLLFISLPFLNKYLPLVEKKKSTENRALAEKPKFDIELLDPFPEQYDKFFNDNFSLRNNYNRFYSYFKFKFFGVNPFPEKVVIGKDGWMFYQNEMLPLNKKKNLLSIKELEIMRKELVSREEYLKQHNCLLYIGIIPAKASIYFDKLKSTHYNPSCDSIPTIGDQFSTYMDSTTDLKILNLRPNLLEVKDDYKLYYQFDYHCNHLGGFFVAKAMLEFIQPDFPDKSMTISLDDFNISYKSEAGGNLSKILGVADFCVEEHPHIKVKNEDDAIKKGVSKHYPFPEDFNYTWGYEVRRTTNNDSLPNCMIIRDSFGSYYREILSHGFNKSFYLWDKWQYQINKEIFLNEHPDVMIIMVPEFNLKKFKNSSN